MGIDERLKEHLSAVEQYLEENQTHPILGPKYEILGVFLYGSQNYNFATPTSDVDTKCIVIPTLAAIVDGTSLSVEKHLPNGEHCEVKDVRQMCAQWRKQNMNMLEILFTKYKIVNPKYLQAWNEVTSQAEDICRYNKYAMYTSIIAQYKASLMKSTTTGKDYANALRLSYSLQKLSEGMTYKEAIVLPDELRDKLLVFKMDKSFNPSVSEKVDLVEKLESLRINEPSQINETAEKALVAFAKQTISQTIH